MIQSIKKIFVPKCILQCDFVSEDTFMKNEIYKNQIKEIVQRYKLFKVRLLNSNNLKKAKKEQYLRYTTKFDTCLKALGSLKEKAFRIGFMNDCFDWWDLNYSIAHSYRIRRQSGIEFLKLFREY